MELAAALELQGKGFYIFPLHYPTTDGCSCGKSECTSVGKHPRISPNKASNDVKQIERLWVSSPQANVGIATGKKSGIFVLDVDDKNANSGSLSLRRLEDEHQPLPATLTATTGNGRHHYFKYPGLPIKCSTGKLGDGLDIRGDGGYVVAPPSVHANGRRYQWTDGSAEIVQAPNWLLDLLTVEDVPDSESIPPGKRTDTLYAEVCVLFRSGMLEPDVMRTALATNMSRCQPPLSEDKVRDVVSRVSKTQRPAIAKTSARNPLRWFQFDVTDFLSDINISTLSDQQLGWRTRLNALAWTHQGRLPNDLAKLAKLANASSLATFKREMLTALFDYDQIEEDGSRILVNPAMAAEYDAKLAGWNQKREAGLSRAKARARGIEQEKVAA
jgi:Bifunctional DNA primase/polymerase, N-terminal